MADPASDEKTLKEEEEKASSSSTQKTKDVHESQQQSQGKEKGKEKEVGAVEAVVEELLDVRPQRGSSPRTAASPRLGDQPPKPKPSSNGGAVRGGGGGVARSVNRANVYEDKTDARRYYMAIERNLREGIPLLKILEHWNGRVGMAEFVRRRE